MLKRGLPIYHVDRVILETGELFNDRSHIVYVNNEIKDGTPLGLLMRDFVCTDAGEMHYSELAEQVKYFKETDEGVSSMCRAMEEMRAEAAAKAKAEGLAEGKAKGLAEGKAKGLAEGEAKGFAAAAERMRRSGIPEEQIQAILCNENKEK